MTSQFCTMVSRVSTSFLGNAIVFVTVVALIAASAVGASSDPAKARPDGSPATEQPAGR